MTHSETNQEQREEQAGGEWTVDCQTCGTLHYYSKREPVVCPTCESVSIEVDPGLRSDR